MAPHFNHCGKGQGENGESIDGELRGWPPANPNCCVSFFFELVFCFEMKSKPGSFREKKSSWTEKTIKNDPEKKEREDRTVKQSQGSWRKSWSKSILPANVKLRRRHTRDLMIAPRLRPESLAVENGKIAFTREPSQSGNLIHSAKKYGNNCFAHFSHWQRVSAVAYPASDCGQVARHIIRHCNWRPHRQCTLEEAGATSFRTLKATPKSHLSESCINNKAILEWSRACKSRSFTDSLWCTGLWHLARWLSLYIVPPWADTKSVPKQAYE